METHAGKRKRTVLDHDKKCMIVQYAKDHPKLSQQELANHFTTLWNVDVKRRTVGQILSNSSQYENGDEVMQPRKRQLVAQNKLLN